MVKRLHIINLLIVNLLIIFNVSSAQQFSHNRQLVYFDLKDTLLINQINRLVQREVDNPDSSNQFKKGYGYVTLHIDATHNKNLIVKYYISPNLFSLKADAVEKLYPDYYTYVNRKLVLVYNWPLQQLTGSAYSQKDKKRIRKLIDAQLEPTRVEVFYDMNGKKTFTDHHFRLDYIKMHGGMYISYYTDRPPLIEEEKRY